MEFVHRSVMGQEALQWLRPDQDGQLLIDATLGEGGHSALFLETYPGLSVCGVDADANIMAKARERLRIWGDRMRFHQAWYDDFFASYPLERKPDRILFDFGISIFHYVESGRGFSFSREEPLDMRLNPDTGPSVAQVVAEMDEAGLADLIFKYGEERYGRRIARGIVEQRQVAPILTSHDLADLIRRVVPADYRHGRIHPATRTFQALRIHVNHELERIEKAMDEAFRTLAVGGILGIITFHSLEDRLVKNHFRDLARECRCPPEQVRCTCDRIPQGELLVRKPVVPTEEECRENPPSRSAKFRFIKKIKENP